MEETFLNKWYILLASTGKKNFFYFVPNVTQSTSSILSLVCNKRIQFIVVFVVLMVFCFLGVTVCISFMCLLHMLLPVSGVFS